MSNKKYGLILPDNTKKPVFQATRNVFGNGDDSDDETSQKTTISFNSKRQAKLAQEKAVVEDPTVYLYDEVYDDMKQKVNEEKKNVKIDKNPKYIESLLKTAQKRKIENERRIERQVHKEREKEGEQFADKEVFVTSAYKKKLEDMRKEDEKERYEEYLENIGDVRKQKDLGGFYRHLYEQKLGPAKSVDKIKQDNPEQKRNTDTEEESDKGADVKTKHIRNYRKRKSSRDTKLNLSEGEIESDDEINRMNLDDVKAAKLLRKNDNIDADSDFSVNDPSDTESVDENKIIQQQAEPTQKLDNEQNKQAKETVQESDKKKCKDVITKKEEIVPKPKIDIWKKRTVGIVLEEALKRYYERKSARNI